MPTESTGKPKELEVLMDQIDVEVNKEQRQQIRELLKGHKDMFVLPRQPLGRTGFVKHEIETGFQAPIKQTVRKPPFHQKSTAEEEVKKMLKNDIIEPSNSPWA